MVIGSCKKSTKKATQFVNLASAGGDNEVTEGGNEVLGGNISSAGNSTSASGSETTAENVTDSEVASTVSVMSNEADRATSEPPESDKDVKSKIPVAPTPSQKIINRVTMAAPIKETGTPETITIELGYRHQPGQVATREGDEINSEAAGKSQQQPIPFQNSPSHDQKLDHKCG